MVKLILKIERKYLQISEVKFGTTRTYIEKVRRFDFPDELIGDGKLESPLDLAKFIYEAVKTSKIATRKAIVLLDSSVALFHEHHKPKSISKKHETGLKEAKTAWETGTNNLIVEDYLYGPHEDQNGEHICAVYGIDSLFMRNFAAFLKERGFKIEYAGSAMLGYTEVVRILLRDIYDKENLRGKNVIAIDIEDHYLRIAVFVNENLFHQNEVEIDLPSDESAQEELLNLIELYTEAALALVDSRLRMDYVFISGEATADLNFERRLAGKLNIPCRTFEYYYASTKYLLDLGGELQGRRSLYSRIISLAGMNPNKKRTANFIYGGMDKRHSRRNIYIISAIIVFVVLLLALIFPTISYLIEVERDKNLAIVENPQYEEARDLLAQRNQLSTQIQMYGQDSQYFIDKNSDTQLLSVIRNELIPGVEIESIKTQDDGLLISFATFDIESFDTAKQSLAGRLNVTEVADRITEGNSVRCQILVVQEGVINEG